MVSSVHTTNSVSRASLYEYVIVLQQVQAIYNNLKNSGTTDVATLVSKAKQLSALEQELAQMETMGIVSATKLEQLSSSITSKLQNLVATVNNARSGQVDIANSLTAVLNDPTFGSALTTALDPTQWDSVVGTTDPTKQLRILDSPQDYAFYELYRTTEAGMNNSVGLLGNQLQAEQQLLAALNLINIGPTWNPGSSYISTSGQLQDLSDGTSWFDKFQTDNISDQMLQGVQSLNTILQGGYFAQGSAESNLINSILASMSNADTANGGYNYCATKTGANNMWSNAAFRTQLQNGVQLVSNINDTAQDQLQRVLLVYQQVSQTLTTLNLRLSDELKAIAKRLNVDKSA